MNLTYDTRHLPSSIPDWDQLLTELSQVPDDTVEKSWLELKSFLDLGTPEHKYTVARAILSFANRDHAAAASFLDGKALVVIGVGGSTMPGIARIEDHDLINKLKDYLGDATKSPRWMTHRHRIDDSNDVLVIIVDAPRPGDPIYCLRKGFNSAKPGAVYVRPSTASEPADPAAIEMLSRRLTAPTRAFHVGLSLNSDAITRFRWDPATLEAALQRELRRYRQQLPKPKTTESNRLGGLGSAIDSWSQIRGAASILGDQRDLLKDRFVTRHEETRTEEEFQEEILAWADKVRARFPRVVRHLHGFQSPAASFTVTNTCGRFLKRVQVAVHIEGAVFQQARTDLPHLDLRLLPRRPRGWGPWEEKRLDASTLARVDPSHLNRTTRPRSNTATFHNSGSISATLACEELRPSTSHTFNDAADQVVIFTTELDLDTVHITATVTALDIDETYTLEFDHPVAPPVDLSSDVDAFIAEDFRFPASGTR